MTLLFIRTAFGQDQEAASLGNNIYLVVDLQTWKHRFTAAPPDLSKDDCRTMELWLRRIPAGKFMMGSPQSEFGRSPDEKQHEVILTQDYYLGVFECTQRQWELVMGRSLPSYTGRSDEPVSDSYNSIRGESIEAGGGWPQRGHAVDNSSFMGILRKKTGLLFDLPTEAQWEYACRAGTPTAFNSGRNMTYRGDPALDEVGRYRFNRNDGKEGNGSTAKVGSYRPNAWGLYDMHGNVSEWCLDQDKFEIRQDVENPVGPDENTNNRIIRGGSCYSYADDCRSANVSSSSLLNKKIKMGFRIVCPLAGDTGDAYLVVNLESGQHRFSSIPPDLSNDVCRTCELWLRRVKAGTFTMGAPADEIGHKDFQRNETQHKVTLTQDYYIGVFECTQKQWEFVTSQAIESMGNKDWLPVEEVSYADIRGSSPEAGGGWPRQGHKVDDDSFMGKLRKRTGLEFDLPTEAQWEYACRAGTTTALNSGKNLSYLGDSALDDFGRYYENQGQEFTHKGKVGSYRPNAWGLYDMHGNYVEWCLDWHDFNYGEEEGYKNNILSSMTNPIGPLTGRSRICRGGSSRSHPEDCRSAAREARFPSMNVETGFRIACLLSIPAMLPHGDASQTNQNDSIERKQEAEILRMDFAEKPQNRTDVQRAKEEAYVSRMKAATDIVLSFNGVRLTLKPVTAGSFINTELNRTFMLKHDYWIGETEVTQGQYEAVMGSNPSQGNKGKEYPVESVSWYDAEKFCSELNNVCKSQLPSGYSLALPTAAQWEYAAHGGDKSQKFMYSGGDDIDSVAWYYENSGLERLDEKNWTPENQNQKGCLTHLVGQKRANELGLYDMSGNVYEWCRDVFDASWKYDPETLEGMQDGRYKVSRGGCWSTRSLHCRSFIRTYSVPEFRGDSMGFRVALVSATQNASANEKKADHKIQMPLAKEEAQVSRMKASADIVLSFNGVNLTLKPVTAGSFTNTELNRAFTLKHDYWIGETEVTQDQYEAVMKINPSENKKTGFPVEQVSWDDARTFCEKLNVLCSSYLPSGYQIDLPTEAQWEFAARGGVKSKSFQHSGSDDIDAVAWYCGNSGWKRTVEMNPGMEQLKASGCSSRPVRQKAANELGLHDMNGNVWEWCRDVFDAEWRHDPESLEGMKQGSFRVRRGGSWNLGAGYCRPSVRGFIDPSYCCSASGFRIVIVPAALSLFTVADTVSHEEAVRPFAFSGNVALPGGTTLEFVKIKAGSFMMGSPKEDLVLYPGEEQHTVILTKDFWLGKTEVTQGQWKAIMGTTLQDQAEKVFSGEGNKGIAIMEDDFPMYYVNWDEAMEFCRKLTEQEQKAGRLPDRYAFTLPTEAQWEYACRAGSTTAVYTGPMVILGRYNAPVLDDIAWYGGNSSVGYVGRGWNTEKWKEKQYSGGVAGPRKVGTRKPNAWGLYDMLGNVFEWCLDWSGKYSTVAVKDPVCLAEDKYRIHRGGSWGADPRYCRSPSRAGHIPATRSSQIGFRVALSFTDKFASSAEMPAAKAVASDSKASQDKSGGTISEATVKSVSSRSVTLPGGTTLELVEIKAGSFTMGSPEDEPGHNSMEVQHEVILTKNFWLGKTEVTQGQWKAVMSTTLLEQAEKEFPGDGRNHIGNVDDDYPMYLINWDEAMEFCRRLTEQERRAGHLPDKYVFTLPTEAQWEYACRAGSTTAIYTGPMAFLGKYNVPALDDIAWYGGNSSVGYTGIGWNTDKWEGKQYPGGRAGPRKVGTRKPNAWGLYDMLGNVCEWCLDWHGKSSTFVETDPVGPTEGKYRVSRGGAWSFEGRSCRSATRKRLFPVIRSFTSGFRVALSYTNN